MELDIKNMTSIQRIMAMEALWDAICHEDSEVISPEWHEEILKERKKRIETNETNFISLDCLKEYLSK